MCDHGTHVDVQTLAGFNGNPERLTVPVDACIAPLVRALNRAGIETLDSCCGHGKGPGCIRLTDGTALEIRVRDERDWPAYRPWVAPSDQAEAIALRDEIRRMAADLNGVANRMPPGTDRATVRDILGEMETLSRRGPDA